MIFTDGEKGEDPHQPVEDLELLDTWFSRSPSAGLYFGSLTNEPSPGSGKGRGVFGSLTHLYVWGYHGAGRADQIFLNGNLESYYYPHTDPNSNRINLASRDVNYAPPSAGERSPALRWRDHHPYDSYTSFFSFLSS